MSSQRLSNRELAAMTPHEAAAYWFVRRDADELTREDQQAFEAWLAASDTHARAFKQTGAMWNDFAGRADEGELRALRVSALTASPVSRVWPRAAALAAMILAAVGLGVGGFAWYSASRQPLASAAKPADVHEYATAHNQRSTLTLPDGTLVSMNLDTALDVNFSGQERRIRLSRGQAFFEVAKDARRPFVVLAADRHIRALGTKFDVRLDAGRVEVVLLEGKVTVDRGNPSLLDKLANRTPRVELSPGQRLIADLDQAAAVTTINAAQATSWREGWLVFEDETLEHAIAELNRYSDQPIVADEAVRQLRLSGVFRIGQSERFASLIEELLPISAQRAANGETRLVLKPDAGTATFNRQSQ